jgi:Trk K+ transport system NAD-binding subunit
MRAASYDTLDEIERFDESIKKIAKIFPGAKAEGVTVRDLNLPPNCIIAGTIHHGEIVIPGNVTTLEEKDGILARVDDTARGQLKKILGRPEAIQCT